MEHKILDNVKIEITIRNPKNIEFDFPEFLTKHLDGKKPGKKIFMLPIDWKGFENGFFIRMKNSGLDVYAALAFSTTGDEQVTGLDGSYARPFIHHLPGGVIKKYVKTGLIVRYEKEEITLSLKVNRRSPVECLVKRCE